MGKPENFSIVVWEDNQSCIALLQADRTEMKSKHIDTKYNDIKVLVCDGVIKICCCPTEQMQADLLSKPLSVVKLVQIKNAIGIRSFNVEKC